MPDLVLFLLIFIAAGGVLLGAGMVTGRLVRPEKPSPEKGTVYECGEPTIGSAWIQFDLRFYVVALLFVIFDVELAFFFPWAVVFGTANRAGNESLPPEVRMSAGMELQPPGSTLEFTPRPSPEELDRLKYSSQGYAVAAADPRAMRQLAWVAFADILVFFGVLLVGFAYLWRRGDLDWVRSTAAQAEPGGGGPP